MDHIIALKTMFQSALTWSQIERNLKKKIKVRNFSECVVTMVFLKYLDKLVQSFFSAQSFNIGPHYIDPIY